MLFSLIISIILLINVLNVSSLSIYSSSIRTHSNGMTMSMDKVSFYTAELYSGNL